MQVIKRGLVKESSPNILWSKVVFVKDNHKSSVYFCASKDYVLENGFLSRAKTDTKKTDEWIEQIVSKWKSLKNDIFNQGVHFDVYTKNQDNESECLNFLLEKSLHVNSFL